jgi:putative addiction module component (TIGR02574 family)
MSHPNFDFSDLSSDERIQLAEDLWDSLDERPEVLPMTDAQAREIDRRLDAYRLDGDRGQLWDLVLDRIDARRHERSG